MHSYLSYYRKVNLSLVFLFFCLTLTVFFPGCINEAGHDNPLDPANGEQRYDLKGQVVTFYQPRQPLANATIQIQPGSIIAVTNESGEYQIPDLKAGRYEIICQLEGYHEDSVEIELPGKNLHDFFLDGLPTFEKIAISTHHLSRWFPREEFYFLSLETDVSDPDGLGDIHSVSFSIPALNFSDTLQAALTGGRFTGSLSDSDLPVASIQALIGHQFVFRVIDDYGVATSSEAQYLTRIIEETPLLRRPVDLQTIEGSQLILEWERIFVPFPSTLRIELFQINFGVAIKIDQIDDIMSNTQSYQYQKPLESSDYFWTIHVVDEFGNSSGSKEGTFRIP